MMMVVVVVIMVVLFVVNWIKPWFNTMVMYCWETNNLRSFGTDWRRPMKQHWYVFVKFESAVDDVSETVEILNWWVAFSVKVFQNVPQSVALHREKGVGDDGGGEGWVASRSFEGEGSFNCRRWRHSWTIIVKIKVGEFVCFLHTRNHDIKHVWLIIEMFTQRGLHVHISQFISQCNAVQCLIR